MRNWWLEIHYDGQRPIETGPTDEQGGFRLDIYQRNRGESIKVGEINGVVMGEVLDLTWVPVGATVTEIVPLAMTRR